MQKLNNTKKSQSLSSLSMLAAAIGIAAFSISCSKEEALLPEVVNGSFEQPVATGNWNSYNTQSADGVTGWTITGGSIELIHDYWAGSDGDQSIDLDGGSAGTIEQTISGFTPGASYVLKFDYSANPENPDKNVNDAKAELLIDGVSVKQIKATTEMMSATRQTVVYQNNESVTFDAASEEVTFTFKSLNNAGSVYGVILDNIRLELAK